MNTGKEEREEDGTTVKEEGREGREKCRVRRTDKRGTANEGTER